MLDYEWCFKGGKSGKRVSEWFAHFDAFLEQPRRYVENMGRLVKRDRNHASITIWSFCNEVREDRRETGGLDGR